MGLEPTETVELVRVELKILVPYSILLKPYFPETDLLKFLLHIFGIIIFLKPRCGSAILSYPPHTPTTDNGTRSKFFTVTYRTFHILVSSKIPMLLFCHCWFVPCPRALHSWSHVPTHTVFIQVSVHLLMLFSSPGKAFLILSLDAWINVSHPSRSSLGTT